jgi:phosphopantetheinyl transferase
VFRFAYLRLGDPEAERLISTISRPADVAYALRFTQPKRRQQSIAARALIRRLLEEASGKPSCCWTIGRGHDGRPRAACDASPVRYDVSISHSRDLVACAIASTGMIGIDVEFIDERRPFRAIAASAFGPGEQREVDDLGAEAFYRIWTLREALGKATSRGLELVTNHIDVLSYTRSDWPDAQWILQHDCILNEYALAIAFCSHKKYPLRWATSARTAAH